MLLRIVAIVFPLFAIVFFGWLYGRKKQPDMAFANQLNMDVFVPALVFAAMADKSFDLAANWGLALGAVVGVAGSGLAGWGLARLLGVAPKTLVPPMMFNNCGNLGLPLTVLAFGDAALGPAVVLFMISNLAHFSFGAWLLDHQTRLSNLWRIPVVLASLLGLLVSLMHMPLWPPLKMAIRMLGDVSIPLLLFSLGVRLAGARLAAVKVGLWGAVARPLVGLLLAYGTALVLGLEGQQKALLVIFGALPPAVLNYVFAERYRQEPDQVASIVMIGNLAALVFLPLALALVLP